MNYDLAGHAIYILRADNEIKESDYYRLLYSEDMNPYKPDDYDSFRYHKVKSDMDAWIGNTVREYLARVYHHKETLTDKEYCDHRLVEVVRIVDKSVIDYLL